MDSADWLDTATPSVQILEGDCLASMASLPGKSVQTCVTSPPYFGLRDYGHDGQIGLEATPSAYVAKMVDVFREVRRVLRDDGTLWLNLGDSYGSSGGDIFTGFNARYDGTGLDGGKQAQIAESAKSAARKPRDTGVRAKNLLGIPWRVAFALQDDGWYLRQDIIWHKPNAMPESVTDRCTKAHEYLFLLSKSPKYYFDYAAIREPAVTGGTDIVGSGFARSGFARSGRRKSKAEGVNGRNVQSRNSEAERRDVVGGSFNNNPRLRQTDGMRNRRSVWSITTKPYKGAHFATFPPDLVEPCVAAGSRPGDTVLDPFGGSGTTAQVALQQGRSAILCELNTEYVELAKERIAKVKA